MVGIIPYQKIPTGHPWWKFITSSQSNIRCSSGDCLGLAPVFIIHINIRRKIYPLRFVWWQMIVLCTNKYVQNLTVWICRKTWILFVSGKTDGKCNLTAKMLCHEHHRQENPIQHSYSMQDSVLEAVDHHTYLAIKISSKLTWNIRVSNISSKANTTLGLLRRHLHSCKPNIKEIGYKSLVRPKLEFCCSIWDPYHQDQKDQLEAVLRKATRFVMRNYKRDSSVSTIIQQLKWQSLEERRAVSRLTFTYKAFHEITAVKLDHLKSSKSSRPTLLNSSAFPLRKLATKKDKYQNSLLPRTSSEWNLLRDHVKSAPSLDAFKAYLQDINITALIRDSHYD